MASDIAGERPLRLLVAERFGWFTRTVATVLDAAGWRVVRASTGLRTLQFVEETSPDIVIIRDDLEDTDPVDLCTALRETREIGLVTPIVVVATDAARSQHVAALRAGAWDYAVQPLDAESFILRIANLARARRQVEQLARAALVDSETGLYNHLGIARRAEEVEADTRRRHAPVSCVVFAPEADNLPKNGSRDVTARVGALLRRRGRGSDVIGRLDNFVAVIAPFTGADGAARLAHRLRGIIREMTDERADQPVRVRAAFVAADDFARSTMNISEMLQRAQDALRRAPADIDGPLSVPGESVSLNPPL
jgi:PleD family two-component response regulator